MKTKFQKIMWSALILLLAVPLYAQNVIPMVDAAVSKLSSINNRLAGVATTSTQGAAGTGDPNLSMHLGGDGALISGNKDRVVYQGGMSSKTSEAGSTSAGKTTSGKSGGQ